MLIVSSPHFLTECSNAEDTGIIVMDINKAVVSE